MDKMTEIEKLEAARNACYDDKGGCNYRRLRKIDKQIRAAAIASLGWSPEAFGPMHETSYASSTSELLRWIREDI